MHLVLGADQRPASFLRCREQVLPMLVLIVQWYLMLACEADSAFLDRLRYRYETESIRVAQSVGSVIVRPSLTRSDEDGINGIRQEGLLSKD
jgi:hypothetical protein